MKIETLETIIAESLQDVWDDECSDTGCVPQCFEIHYPSDLTEVQANFKGSSFCRRVAELVSESLK